MRWEPPSSSGRRMSRDDSLPAACAEGKSFSTDARTSESGWSDMEIFMVRFWPLIETFSDQNCVASSRTASVSSADSAERSEASFFPDAPPPNGQMEKTSALRTQGTASRHAARTDRRHAAAAGVSVQSR